jgi:hypothetical protein
MPRSGGAAGVATTTSRPSDSRALRRLAHPERSCRMDELRLTAADPDGPPPGANSAVGRDGARPFRVRPRGPSRNTSEVRRGEPFPGPPLLDVDAAAHREGAVSKGTGRGGKVQFAPLCRPPFLAVKITGTFVFLNIFRAVAGAPTSCRCPAVVRVAPAAAVVTAARAIAALKRPPSTRSAAAGRSPACPSVLRHI